VWAPEFLKAPRMGRHEKKRGK